MRSLENRLKRLESVIDNNDIGIQRKIYKGAYYDELTDDEKDRYLRYINFQGGRDVFEDIHLLFFDTLHNKLADRPPKMTPEEERRHIAEVSKEIEAYLNQPEGEDDVIQAEGIQPEEPSESQADVRSDSFRTEKTRS